MAEVFEVIEEHHAAWIARQRVFFVGSAPLAADGHVNLSPKGPIGTFRVLGPRRVAYLDYSGSGAETIAHLRENGRVVVMFCAFEGPPRILRLHGVGRPVMPGDPGFEELLGEASFEEPWTAKARRSIVEVDVQRVATSCGYGVPLMSHEGERPHMELSKAKRLKVGGPDALARYMAEGNARSIDGLPAVTEVPPVP